MNTAHIARHTLALAAALFAGVATLHAEDAPPAATPAPDAAPKIIIPRDLDSSDSPAAPSRPGSPSASSPQPLTPSPSGSLPGNDQQFWTLHWKRIAMGFAHFGDHIYAAPNFDPRFPSSLHTTADRYIADHTIEQKVTSGGTVRNYQQAPAREEAIAAANCLPDFAAGAYGFIHSAKVVTVVGPEEMIVSEVVLIDPQEIAKAKETLTRAKQIASAQQEEQRRLQQEEERKRNLSGTNNRNTTSSSSSSSSATRDIEREFKLNFEVRQKIAAMQDKNKSVQLRLVGFSTASMTAGATWRVPGSVQGAQVVLVADDKPAAGKSGTSGSAHTTSHYTSSRNAPILAINAELFTKAPTEAQFLQVLGEADLTKPGFCSLARDIMKANKGDDVPVIVLAIETARKKHQAAAAKEEKAALDAAKESSKSGSSSREKSGSKKAGSGNADTAPSEGRPTPK